MGPIELSPYDRVLIEKRIAEFVAGSEAWPEIWAEARTTIARQRLLPLLYHWNGFYALNQDGQVVYLNDVEAVFVEQRERFRNIALFTGSRRYPEIQALVVIRPPDAIDCTHCGGTGQVILPDTIAHITNIVCYCGGLGWVPHDDPG